MTERRHPIFSFLGCLCVTYGVGLVGAEGANQGIASWYLILDKPAWAPPMWLFAPSMSLLYGLMGIALWLVRSSKGTAKSSATVGFGLQLALSGLWPWLFFAGHLLMISAAENFVLWIATFLAIFLMFRASRLSGALLIPCLLWVTFASALNFSVWRLNPHGAGVQIVTPN